MDFGRYKGSSQKIDMSAFCKCLCDHSLPPRMEKNGIQKVVPQVLGLVTMQVLCVGPQAIHLLSAQFSAFFWPPRTFTTARPSPIPRDSSLEGAPVQRYSQMTNRPKTPVRLRIALPFTINCWLLLGIVKSSYPCWLTIGHGWFLLITYKRMNWPWLLGVGELINTGCWFLFPLVLWKQPSQLTTISPVLPIIRWSRWREPTFGDSLLGRAHGWGAFTQYNCQRIWLLIYKWCASIVSQLWWKIVRS